MDKAGDVTIDTHAVAAGLLRPLSGKSIEVTHNFGGTGIANSSITGNKGTYALYAEAYRQAAKERGVLPREMQSITWEAVRGLFNPQYKGQASNVQYIDNIWAQYKSGDITIEEEGSFINCYLLWATELLPRGCGSASTGAPMVTVQKPRLQSHT